MEPTAAEALAMIQGARLCKELEGDAQVIISAIQNGGQLGSRWGRLVDDVHTTI